MKLLLDTNIFLEIILDQEKAAEAKILLSDEKHELCMSDYSLHSIGLLLFRRNLHSAFQNFVQDVILVRGTDVVSVESDKMGDVIQAAQEFQLDFDDAYQYALAKNAQITLVSFDSDFNRTTLGRKTPQQIIQETETDL
jgi:uncharacterized protein